MGRGQFMSDSRHENESGLIIEPALLADIQAACRRRAAELETATSAESRLSLERPRMRMKRNLSYGRPGEMDRGSEFGV